MFKPTSPHAARTAPALVVAVVLLAAVPAARALINPEFTPVHLTRQADAIVLLTVGPLTDEGSMTAKIDQVLKGKFAEKELQIFPMDPELTEKLPEEVFHDGEAKQALLFVSRGEDDKAGESAYVSLAHQWFVMSKDEDGWWMQPGGQGVDLMAVWEGRTDMLAACVRYIVKHRDADVPVKSGSGWAGAGKVAQVPVPEGDDARVELLLMRMPGVDGPVALLLSPAGDRALSRDAESGAFVDVTEKVGLRTASRAGAAGDFNADNRADLLTWDGAQLRVHVQNEVGRLVPWGAGAPVDECIGLGPLPAADDAAAALVSTKRWPARAAVGVDGKMEVAPLGTGDFPGADLKAPHACVVADFDGDTLADVVQPFRAGALFYKGKADGTFAAPQKREDLFGGFGTMRPHVADLDGDGALDIVLFGSAGMAAWRNVGDGRFVSLSPTGETDRFVRGDASGGAVGDFNNDGRQDVAVFYERGAPQLYFSRGFATFGFARGLALEGDDMLPQSTQGQRAGLLYDCNGDGAQDMLMVLADGSVCVAWQARSGPPLLSVEFRPSAAGCRAGPVRVVGRTPQRLLGAWNLAPGGPPALYSRSRPGPILLELYRPGGAKETMEVIVEDGPVRRELPLGR
jgi:hypothetical protein